MNYRPPKLGEPLSHSEMTVLKRLAYGRTNPEIGRDIHLSEDTVKTHVRTEQASARNAALHEALQEDAEVDALEDQAGGRQP